MDILCSYSHPLCFDAARPLERASRSPPLAPLRLGVINYIVITETDVEEFDSRQGARMLKRGVLRGSARPFGSAKVRSIRLALRASINPRLRLDVRRLIG
jgi:hypothetical protein